MGAALIYKEHWISILFDTGNLLEGMAQPLLMCVLYVL